MARTVMGPALVGPWTVNLALLWIVVWPTRVWGEQGDGFRIGEME